MHRAGAVAVVSAGGARIPVPRAGVKHQLDTGSLQGRECAHDADGAGAQAGRGQVSPEGDRLITSGAHYLRMSKKDLVQTAVEFQDTRSAAMTGLSSPQGCIHEGHRDLAGRS